MRAVDQRGFSVLELLVSLTVMLFCLSGLAKLMLENSRINKAQQMTVQAQATARNCISMLEQRLRSAGWDPLNTGLGPVTLDSDPGDAVAEIEIYADLDGNGDTDGTDEQILIRHSGNEITWRRSSDVNEPFVVVASQISNDADGDGVVEPMFVVDSTVDPRRITIQVTAVSPEPDPLTGEFIRHTMSSDVILRNAL